VIASYKESASVA